MIRTTILSAIALSFALWAGPGLAADFGDSEVVYDPMTEPTHQRSVLVGAGVGVQPLYEGSDEYRSFIFPIIAPNFGDPTEPRRFEFRGLDDIRVHLFRAGAFSAGPLLGYRFGRDEDDADILTGLGDIEGGLVVGAFAGYDFIKTDTVNVGADIGFSTQVTGDAFDEGRFVGIPAFRDSVGDDYGYKIDLGLSADFDLTQRLNLATRIGTEYADDEYMRTHFGIAPIQAASSAAVPGGAGLPAFEAEAGFKNIYLNADVTYEVTERVQFQAGLGFSRLLGDAADSPVTQNENQFQASTGVGFRIKF